MHWRENIARTWILSAVMGGWLLFVGPSAATPAADTRSYYLITLSQTPLAEAADAVLVNSLGSTVQIDAGLEADVTLAIAAPMTVEELEIAFATELTRHGIVLIRQGSGFRLADLAVAMSETPRPLIVGPPLPTPRPSAVSSSVPAVLVAPGPAQRDVPIWAYAALVLVIAGAAGIGIRFRSSLLTRIRAWGRRRTPVSARIDGVHRDAVVDWILTRSAVPLPLLASACDLAARQGRPVEQALCDVGAISEAGLADAYCAVAGLSRWDPATAAAPTMWDESLDRFVRQRSLRIVEMDEWSVVVACADPLDDRLYAELSRRTGRMVTLRVACLSQVAADRTAGMAPERHASPVIVPWSRARPDGARLLQTLLARRSSADPAGEDAIRP